MIVEGRQAFAAPRETVYALLQDPDVLVKVLPGAKSLARTAENRFEGVMAVGVGPVTAAEFAVVVELHDQVPPTHFGMRIDGKGVIGFTRGNAAVDLTEEAGQTVMVYRADLQVGGKIAGVGQRLLDSVSRTMTRQGLDALNRELEARIAPAVAAPAVAAKGQAWKPRHIHWIAVIVLVALAMIGFCSFRP
jgi:carbon monoxide dehydrogenase subunit G